MTQTPAPGPAGSPDSSPRGTPEIGLNGSVRAILDQDRAWIHALIIVTTLVSLFVLLGFLAAYFQDYLGIILIFFFAWFIAFLVAPPVDWIERKVPRIPRAVAVIVVIIPVLVGIGALIVAVLASIARSLLDLNDAIAASGGPSPAWLDQLQTWLDDRGIHVDVAGTFHSMVPDALKTVSDFALSLVGGAVSTLPAAVNVIVVISLGVFLAIDRDRFLSFGLELVPPAHRDEAVLFRTTVARSFNGFIRSQLALGAIYGVWAFIVAIVLGIPSALGAAFLSGAIMAIPILGPYVSWLPPVVIAALFTPDVAILAAVLMLIGWFIDENILAPIVRAGAVDLNPVVVTAAFLIGAHLAGAVGALVSVPIAAIMSSIFFYYRDQRRMREGQTPASSEARLADTVPSKPPPPDATASSD